MIIDTGEPAYAVNRGGSIVAWNAAASSTFGYSKSQAIGTKCWELLQGRDAFDNFYCSERCPLREMIFRHNPVNRCLMSFRTADTLWKKFKVTTLVLIDTNNASLLHLCRKELGSNHETAALRSPREKTPWDGKNVLTPREQQVLRKLSDGRSTCEIASLLNISVKTVRNHVEHILHKLHAHSRLEAVATATRLGLQK